eukprot:6000758-Pleurochrysis_carterae.AAC.1
MDGCVDRRMSPAPPARRHVVQCTHWLQLPIDARAKHLGDIIRVLYAHTNLQSACIASYRVETSAVSHITAN